MAHRITLISGDGARPEITQDTIQILRATGVQLEEAHPVIGEILEFDEQGVARMFEDFGFPLNTMSGPSDRPCAETRSRERQ